jgi:hypothetical protein
MTVAKLSGARRLDAIAPWGRRQDPAVVRALGWTRPTTPAGSTLHEGRRRIAPVGWKRCGRPGRSSGADPGQRALDGTAWRGSHAQGTPPRGGIDAVAAYAQEAGLVLAQTGGERGHR